MEKREAEHDSLPLQGGIVQSNEEDRLHGLRVAWVGVGVKGRVPLGRFELPTHGLEDRCWAFPA